VLARWLSLALTVPALVKQRLFVAGALAVARRTPSALQSTWCASRGSAVSISWSQPRHAAVTGVLEGAEWPGPSNRLLTVTMAANQGSARCGTLSDLLKGLAPAPAHRLFRCRVPAGGDLQRLLGPTPWTKGLLKTAVRRCG
jgi:hypothetical protein